MTRDLSAQRMHGFFHVLQRPVHGFNQTLDDPTVDFHFDLNLHDNLRVFTFRQRFRPPNARSVTAILAGRQYI